MPSSFRNPFDQEERGTSMERDLTKGPGPFGFCRVFLDAPGKSHGGGIFTRSRVG